MNSITDQIKNQQLALSDNGEPDEVTPDLGELIEEIRAINEKNGWNPIQPEDWTDDDRVYRIPNCLALIHSEVSEALEAFRNRDHDNFMEEIADVFIRTLDLIGGMEAAMSFEDHIEAKLEKNRNRSFRHGGKRV